MKIKAMRLPSYHTIFEELAHVVDSLDSDTSPCEVRLSVQDDGSWSVLSGEPGFDTDHKGYWGAAEISYDSDDETLESTALDLLAQVAEEIGHANLDDAE